MRCAFMWIRRKRRQQAPCTTSECEHRLRRVFGFLPNRVFGFLPTKRTDIFYEYADIVAAEILVGYRRCFELA